MHPGQIAEKVQSVRGSRRALSLPNSGYHGTRGVSRWNGAGVALLQSVGSLTRGRSGPRACWLTPVLAHTRIGPRR